MFKLNRGDKVGIVSPSRQITSKSQIELGLEYLQNLGLQPVLGAHVFDSYRYMAGIPQDRAADLMSFYKNPEIKAIFSTCGGDGSQFIPPFLDFETIAKNPKPLIGFSDTTAVQLAIYSQTKIPQISGFLLEYDFRSGHIDPTIDKSLRTLLSGQKLSAQGGKTVHPGTVEGIFIGGCLSLFRNLCGTPYFPDLTDTILLIEDEEEKTYKLDLMLEQLRQSPHFDKVRGIVFGGFWNCEIRKPQDGSPDEIIKYFAERNNIPIITNFPYGHGHGKKRYTLPIGVKMRLDADNCTLEQI